MEHIDQLGRIESNEWDTLIVLDACRFDYFKSAIQDSKISGCLEKAVSPASTTHQWLKKTFNGQEDIRLISGHPGINGKDFHVLDYRAKDHFSEVVDAWELSWDNEMGGSLAGDVTDVALNLLKWDKRQIVWYMQPHFPWFGRTMLCGTNKEDKEIESTVLEWNREAYDDLKHGKYEKDFVRQGYRDNLAYVMEEVERLLDKGRSEMGEKVVITSDHGELLMEPGLPDDRQFGHYGNVQSPYLREVPWFTVTREDEAEIFRKMQSLGYF